MEPKTDFPLRAALLAGLLVTFIAAPAANAAKVYRWVDENGEVHYTESLPPGYDKEHDVLNERGIVVDEGLSLKPEPVEEDPEEQVGELPRDSSGLPRPKPMYTEEEKQRRMDSFLMLRYDSEEEIVDAMNVEIKQLNYDRDLLQGSQKSLIDSYRGQIRVAADRQRAGKPVDADVEAEINRLRTRMAKNGRELDSLAEREANIRADFQKQLERYRFLVEKYAEEQAG